MGSRQFEKAIDEGFEDVEVERLEPVAPVEEEPVCLGPAPDGESEDEVISFVVFICMWHLYDA